MSTSLPERPNFEQLAVRPKSSVTPRAEGIPTLFIA